MIFFTPRDRRLLRMILDNQGVIMTVIQDLTDAINVLADDVATEIAALAAAIAASQPDQTPDADVAASVKRLTDLSVALKASVAPPAPVV